MKMRIIVFTAEFKRDVLNCECMIGIHYRSFKKWSKIIRTRFKTVIQATLGQQVVPGRNKSRKTQQEATEVGQEGNKTIMF